MSDNNLFDKLEPVAAEKLFVDFADFTIAELILEINEGRVALEQEKKAHAVDEFARGKLETECEDLRALCEDLRARIQGAKLALSGQTEETEE